MGALESARHCLQTACCALARLLPLWHGAPSWHNVSVLCRGRRYGVAWLAWRKHSTLVSCLLQGLHSPDTVGIRKYLRLETGFSGVWSTWQALSYICLTFRKGSRGILPPGTLWLSSGTSTRLTWETSCCKAQSRFSADLGLCRDYLCCCLGYLMDALEKVPGDLQEQSTHAALPIEKGSRQWHTGIDRMVPRKSISQLEGSPCEACS